MQEAVCWKSFTDSIFGQVAVHPEPRGMIVYKKVWDSKIVQGKLAQHKGPWLYDNRKLSW